MWNTTNPTSPLNVHKDGSVVRARVESVSFIRRANGVADLAQVRYAKAERQSAEATDRITHWIATIQYVYAAPSKNPRIRAWNPLGFKIVEIESEPEVLTSVASAGNAGSQGVSQ
jgi:type IV secretion system protein VirB8